jgi:hypothetical protein
VPVSGPNTGPATARKVSARIIDPYGGHSVTASMPEGNRSWKAEDVLSESTALDAAAVPVWWIGAEVPDEQ